MNDDLTFFFTFCGLLWVSFDLQLSFHHFLLPRQVCALLGGGGYAEKINVPAVQVFPVPKGISLQHAAAIPEVACTVWSTIFMTCHLKKGETLLVR